jgi:hypothetical protein
MSPRHLPSTQEIAFVSSFLPNTSHTALVSCLIDGKQIPGSRWHTPTHALNYLAVLRATWPILDGMYTDGNQTTMQAYKVRGRQTYRIFRKPTECFTHFANAARTLSLPACRYDDCSPLDNVCAVEHARLFALCLGLKPLELAAELIQFRADWFDVRTMCVCVSVCLVAPNTDYATRCILTPSRASSPSSIPIRPPIFPPPSPPPRSGLRNLPVRANSASYNIGISASRVLWSHLRLEGRSLVPTLRPCALCPARRPTSRHW